MKVLTVFGTRPEAIKLAPVVQALGRAPGVQQVVCVTGQHRQMLDQVLDVFRLSPDHRLDIMRDGQDLGYVTAAVLQGVTHWVRSERPDWVVVQGDTTTAFAAALAAFYGHAAVAHVEAGLRTGDAMSPWPEEMNRRLVSPLADLHFAPTARAAQNLVREAVPADRVFVTGNTVIDALRWVADRPEGPAALSAVLAAHAPRCVGDRSRVLVTLHRRESLGDKLRSLCHGLRKVAQRGDVEIVFPVHLNPLVRSVVQETLGGQDSVHLLPPLDYLPFVALLRSSHFVVTDSGGIQEEAPGLGKPVLVARDTTERPEAVEAGTAEIVGTDGEHVAARCDALLDDPEHYARMARAQSPFGDGHAAQRIVDLLVCAESRRRRA